MCSVLGPFTRETWPEGQQLLSQLGFSLQAVQQQSLSQWIPNACQEAIDLITRLCSWDPSKRPTASQALQHPFFKVCGANSYPASRMQVMQVMRFLLHKAERIISRYKQHDKPFMDSKY